MEKIVFTVSELNLATQKIMEGHFPNILVQGEISNLVRPVSGHIYFSLKDARAQVRCAMFKPQARLLNFDLQNGLSVELKAKVSIYPDRGDYQLIVESIQAEGDGLLRKAFDALLKKLQTQGLFDVQYKKPLPSFPSHIGVITSPTGAAIRDILSVLKRRFKDIAITVFPTKVQGNEAADEIVTALKRANQYPLDVLILARGGGSLEDLWPFNEEKVANAIFASHLPIITGIGHEIDFTIADFVADKRAPTPSAAAELISPNQAELSHYFISIEQRLKQLINNLLNNSGQHLDFLLKRLKHPGQHIKQQSERLNDLKVRLSFCMQQVLKDKRQTFEATLRTLHMVSPLATLSRGFAIVENNKGHIIDSVKSVQINEALNLTLQDGKLKIIVEG